MVLYQTIVTMKRRKISSVNIMPIDSATVPVSTDKGVCEHLVNMRKEHGQWSPVARFDIHVPLDSTDGFEILYYHPVFTDGGGYIVLKGGVISYCRVAGRRLQAVGTLCNATGSGRPSVTSSGNILFITFGSGTDVAEKLFLARDNRYEPVYMESLLPVEVGVSAQYYELQDNGSVYVNIGTITQNDDGTVTNEVSLVNHLAKLHDRGYITGSLYLMAAYRMVDGSVASGTQAVMMPVEYNDMELIAGGIRMARDGNVRRFSMTMSGAKLTLSLTLPDGVADNPLIDSVALFMTDAIPVYDPVKLTIDGFDARAVQGTGSDTMSYAPRTVMLSEVASQAVERPFYLLKEVKLSEFSGGTHTFTIGYDDIKDLIHNELYEPGFSVHYTVSSGKYEYNNRMHRYGLTTRLYEGRSIVCGERTRTVRRIEYVRQDFTGIDLLTVVTLDCDGTTMRVIHKKPAHLYFSNNVLAPGSSSDRYLLHDNMLSYPDSRATDISFVLVNGTKARTLAHYKLKPCYEHNISYWCSLTENLLHHVHVVNVGSSFVYDETIPVADNVLHEPGKMIASSATNPLVFDPAHTYLLGSGTSFAILRAEAAAGELTQTRYGDYPLLLFTTQGIYAMEQGSDAMLYVRSVKVVGDMLSGTCDTLSVRGLVFFITVRGVMVLDGREVTKISEAIDHLLTDDYLKGARLFYASAYDEVFLFNPSYKRAYVYAIGGGWTERDLDATPVSGSLFISSGGIFSLDGRESEAAADRLTPSLLTRPLMLGSDEFKHIDVFAAYMSAAADSKFTTVLEGSNDLKTWSVVFVLDGLLRARHAAMSWRYYRIRFTASAVGAEPLAISSFDVEYYSRFTRHLRARQ